MKTHAPSRPTCPHCAATVRTGMAWCSLCFGSLAAPADVRVPAPDGQPLPDDDDPAAVDRADHGLDVAVDPDADVDVDALAEGMLAQLAAGHDQPLGARLPRSMPATVALMAGGGTAGCVVLLLVLYVLGLLL